MGGPGCRSRSRTKIRRKSSGEGRKARPQVTIDLSQKYQLVRFCLSTEIQKEDSCGVFAPSVCDHRVLFIGFISFFRLSLHLGTAKVAFSGTDIETRSGSSFGDLVVL